MLAIGCGRTAWLSRRRLVPVFRQGHFRTLSGAPHKPRSLSPIAVFLAAGGVIAGYFLWPSKSCSAPTIQHQSIAPSHFTPTTLTSSEQCGPDLKLLTLNIPPHSLPPASDLSPIWTIFVKDNDIQVERPYTPLEGIDEHGSMRFWVKRYAKGEVGRWLHSKCVGETIEIRGPLKTFPVYEGTWDEIIMISGGTGFSPFHQLLHDQLFRGNSVTSSTRFTLLHASRNPSELPPASLLQPLVDMAKQHPERLRIHLFVDSFGKEYSLASSSGLMNVGRIDKGAIARALVLDPHAHKAASWWQRLFRRAPSPPENSLHNSKNILVLVCGPEEMVAAIAGPYGRNNSQGAVGGALRELGFESRQVWKL